MYAIAGEEKRLLCDSGSELRLQHGGREGGSRRKNGVYNRSKEKIKSMNETVRLHYDSTSTVRTALTLRQNNEDNGAAYAHSSRYI